MTKTKAKTKTKKRTGRRPAAPPKARKGMGGVKTRGELITVCGKCYRRPLPGSGVFCPWCGKAGNFVGVPSEKVNRDYTEFGL